MNLSLSPQPSRVCSMCKHHLQVITDANTGEAICSRCGMVILDRNQNVGLLEGRAFSSEEYEARSRTGMPMSLAIHDMGLATLIGKTDRDATGRKIDNMMHTTMQRLRTWDLRSHVRPSDRSLAHAFNELRLLEDKLALPNVVIEKAAYIYRKAHDKKLLRGRPISALVAASVHIACREMSTTWTLKDIASASNIERKQLSKAYTLLYIELDIKVPLSDQTKCIAIVANKANLSEKTKRHAIKMMDQIKETQVSAGKNPMGLAGTILYLSCLKTGENKTEVDIAEAAGMTEVTMRNRIRDLKTNYQIE